MGKNWQANRRRDYFYKKAKSENYRSRAAFKLRQMCERYRIIKEGDIVIDLGANPGGWCQMAKELVGEEGLVIGIDLKPIEPIKNVHLIRGNAKSERVKKMIDDILAKEREKDIKINVVISDMSPNISGNYSMDHAVSIELAELSLSFAEKYLRPGGGYVVKVFDGDMTHDFFHKEIRTRFRMAKRHSPIASRSASSEIYIIALGYKGLDKEDIEDRVKNEDEEEDI